MVDTKTLAREIRVLAQDFNKKDKDWDFFEDALLSALQSCDREYTRMHKRALRAERRAWKQRLKAIPKMTKNQVDAMVRAAMSDG